MSSCPAVRDQTGRVRWWGPDALLLAVLLAGGLVAVGFLLGDDLYLYADNPGQFARLWFAADLTLPGQGRLVGWVPSWYAGSPELQFYPPGAVLLGLLVRALSLGQLSTVAAYQATMVVAYLLPAVTAYAFLRWAGFGRSGATLAGVIALTFPELWGGVEGVMVGMLGDRLAFALFPAALACGVAALAEDAGRWRVARALIFGAVLSAIFLLHPFHVVAPWLAVLFYWLARVRSVSAGAWIRRAILALGLPVLVTLGLTAWWFAPLVAHSGFSTPALRANVDGFLYWLQAGQFPLFVVLALSSLLILRRPGQLRALVVALVVLPLVLVAWIVFSYVMLIDQLGFYTLDPIRFIDEVYFSVVLLAAMGLGALIQDTRCRMQTKVPRSLASGIVYLASCILILALTISFWNDFAQFRSGSQPRFLSQANAQYRLPELWAELAREPGGRVLVTSSQVHFRDEAEDWPSYLMTTIPVWTGRETIGGTFHHWTPVAVTYWYGTEHPAVMRELTHLLDDRRLFGRSWDQMDDAWLHEMCRRLNVTTILTADDDVNARGFLDRSARFQSYWNNAKFFLYRVSGYDPTVLDYDPGALSARVTERDAARLVIRVDRAEAGAQLGLKLTAYPLWQATAAGQDLPIARDALGLMRLSLPAGAGYDLVLTYRDGLAEVAGALVSLSSLLGALGALCVLVGWSTRRRR